MKIGMILDEEFPPDARVENEALSLINSGHEVFLFCINYEDKFQLKDEDYKNIKVRRYYYPKFVKKLSALAYTISLYHFILRFHIKSFLLLNKIDIIHIHDIRIARSVFKLKKIKQTTILDLHENRPEIMKYYSWVNSFLGKLLVKPRSWAKYEAIYLKKTDKAIVVTQEAKDYYIKNLKINPQKIFVVPNSVIKEFYTDYKINDEIISRYKNNYSLLYLGETGLRRGLMTVIVALKTLKEVIPSIKLVIVGNSKDDHILKSYVIKNKLENYVDFEGWKDVSFFQSYILACKIGISPIHRNIHHDTTYANKIFQYMSFGKPIIVSDCPPQKEIVEKYECGMFFKSENPDNFALQVLKLYRDNELYNQMSVNSKKAIDNNLNWDISSKELIEIYEQKS